MKKKEAASLEEGYFPWGSSVLRQVHENRFVGLLYGQRALLIGGTDPRNYIGTSEHTRERATPFHRLARTAQTFEKIYFGSKAEADELLAKIKRIHGFVKGELPKAAGVYPAGTKYSALDPEMMLWTIACIADSAQTLYEMLERPLSDTEREQLWQDYRLMGELFGLSSEHMPETYDAFREYFDARLTGGKLYLTESAEYMGKQVCFNVPTPDVAGIAKGTIAAILLASLPPQIREMYHLDWDEATQKRSARAVSRARKLAATLPAPLKHGGNGYLFALVSDTEKRLGKQGKQVIMPDDPYHGAPITQK